MAFVPNSQLFPTAFAQYDQFLTENNVVKGTQDAEMIKRVGQRIAVAAERWLNANGYQGYLKDYKWEYNLVDDKTVNAWCMPGGKVVFYTGILPICKDEAGIAVVMGHEIAHAIARHGAERMAYQKLVQIGSMAASVALGDMDYETQRAVMGALGVGAQYGVLLPFSRDHESEADYIGLLFVARACFDPTEAPKLWERMGQMSQGNQPSEFMSTHPSHETRIKQFEEWMPEALAIREQHCPNQPTPSF